MRRLVVGVDFGENFSSGARMFVEVLRPAVCLMSDKAVYCTRITHDVVRGWLGPVCSGGGVQTTQISDLDAS